MDGKVHGRQHDTSPCDNERTIALWTNALQAYEGKSLELIGPAVTRDGITAAFHGNERLRSGGGFARTTLAPG